MSETIYYVYKTTNLINGKIYIGKHSTTNLNDNYIGSGTIFLKAVKKHGKQNFKREILKFFNTDKEMADYENLLVTEEFVASNDNYNIIPGGSGGKYPNQFFTKEQRAIANKKSAETQRGRTKETHAGIARSAEKQTGRTKDNHPGVASMAAKQKGKTMENHLPAAIGAAKRRGRKKEDFEYLQRASELMSKLCKEHGNPSAKVWLLENEYGNLVSIINLIGFCLDINIKANTIRAKWRNRDTNSFKTGPLKGWKVLDAELLRIKKQGENYDRSNTS